LIRSILNTNVCLYYPVKFFGIDKVLKPCAIVVIVLSRTYYRFFTVYFSNITAPVCESFSIISHRHPFVKNFFKFFSKARFERQLVYYSRTLLFCQHFFSKILTFFSDICKQPFS